MQSEVPSPTTGDKLCFPGLESYLNYRVKVIEPVSKRLNGLWSDLEKWCRTGYVFTGDELTKAGLDLYMPIPTISLLLFLTSDDG